MKRVLILQNEISSYNVGTYNEIAKNYELTVGYLTKDKSTVSCSFRKHKFESFSMGPFTFVNGLRPYCKQFDVVCIIPNLRIPSYCLIPFLPHDYKVVSWSIGFRCSYEHPYITDRKHVFADKVFQAVLARCDANIFYMEKSKEFWRETSLRMDNVYIAPNTTDVVVKDFLPERKKDFLFVGTLYRGKGLDLLLTAFKQFKDKTGSKIKLVIVGGGEMADELNGFVKQNDLTEEVLFTGPVFNEDVLSDYFISSLLCFSPTQAGLSVPKSMGYGVPFVTRKNAITGGEIYHITDGVNGVVYSSDDQLLSIMVDADRTPEKYIEMGKKARDYYFSKATIRHMAEGAMSAFNV